MAGSGSMTRGCVSEELRYNNAQKCKPQRSIADGQSQHSFSNNSGRFLNTGAANAYNAGLVSSRPGNLQAINTIFVCLFVLIYSVNVFKCI